MTYTDPPLPDGYLPKRRFWTPQQRECFDKSLPQWRFAEFMEPRCGKTDPIVVKTCYYFERKSHPLHVTGLLVIAFPNGVHRGWVTEAFPENVPDRIRWKGLIWRSDKCRQVGFKQSLEEVCKTKGLALLAINVESLGSEETRKAIGMFLKARGRVHVVFDESSALVNSDALRARIMTNIGKATQYVKMMSILDGTPVDKNGPLDYYSQVGWMGHDILGYPNEVEFRKRFAEIKTFGRAPFWRKVKEVLQRLEKEGVVKKEFIKDAAERIAKGEKVPDEADEARIKQEKLAQGMGEKNASLIATAQAKKRKMKRGRDWWTDVAIDNATGMPLYRNMDEIWTKLEPISYRATFAACFPDAKKKVYQKRFFQLSDKQRKAYDELLKEFKFTLGDDTIKAEHPLTRLLRCQQITSNYYPEQVSLALHEPCGGLGCSGCDDTGAVESTVPMRKIDPDYNPRLDALALELKLGKPFGVWCRFRQEVDDVLGLCRAMGISVCRYDGAAGPDEKADSREGFQAGKYDGIVGNETSLSRGIPLYRAEMLIAQSNMFSFRTRRQVEDRAEHGRKKTATAIIDIVAEDTVDDLSIIPALRMGHDVSAWVMQDAEREWI